MKSLLFTLALLPLTTFSQFSFESFHCYKIESTEEIYCFDYIPIGGIDVEDMLFVMTWYGFNEFGVMDFLEFVGDYGTPGCEMSVPNITDYLVWEQTGTGAIFTYSDSTGELLWTDSDEFDNLTSCELVCLNSFIYIWNGDTFYFHR